MGKAETRNPGYFGECSTAIVAVKQIVVYTRNEQVRVTVVVEVGGRGTHRITGPCHSGTIRDISEGQVAIVSEETVLVPVTDLAQRRTFRAVGEIDVHEAIAIVVQYRHAARHRFDLMFLSSRGVLQPEAQAALRCHVLKLRRWESFSLCRRYGADTETRLHAPAAPQEVWDLQD